MAHRVFFCYHHETDSWRANQVIQRWLSIPGNTAAGILSPSELNKLRQKGTEALKNWVDDEMKDCSVLAVLIGTNTTFSDITKYSIMQAMKNSGGKIRGFVGIHINNIKNEDMERDEQGTNLLENFYWKDKKKNITFLSEVYTTYDWFNDKGPFNINSWIEHAEAVAEGRHLGEEADAFND